MKIQVWFSEDQHTPIATECVTYTVSSGGCLTIVEESPDDEEGRSRTTQTTYSPHAWHRVTA